MCFFFYYFTIFSTWKNSEMFNMCPSDAIENFAYTISGFKILMFEMMIFLCVSGCFLSVWICCWEGVYAWCWAVELHCLLPHRDLWMCVFALLLWVTALQRHVEPELSLNVSVRTLTQCVMFYLFVKIVGFLCRHVQTCVCVCLQFLITVQDELELLSFALK